MTQQLNNNNQQLWALIAEVPGWMPGQGAKISQLHSTTKKKKKERREKCIDVHNESMFLPWAV